MLRIIRFIPVLSIALLMVAGGAGEVGAAANDLRPYVVFVNGWDNCCAWDMEIVKASLPANTEIRKVPYSHFQDGGKSSLGSDDSRFITEGLSFINRLDPNRPLILIGHSYGGDSVLKLASHALRREILLLAVIDPVAGGGFRKPVTNYTVPSNVYYFYNRWEENGEAAHNMVPFDSRLFSGRISKCDATFCDQGEQSVVKEADGSGVRKSCGWWEVSCVGYRLPGCKVKFQGVNTSKECWKGSNGTKWQRMLHQTMPYDKFLQTELAAAIKSVLSRRAYFNVGRTIYYLNGTQTCAFNSPSRYSYYRKVFPAADLPEVQDPSRYGKSTGICPMPSGYFNDGRTTYFSNGKSYCGFRSPPHYAFHRAIYPGQSLPQVEDPALFNQNTGACPMPSGYFNDGRTTYFTNGKTFCGFRSPPHYAFYRDVNPGPSLPQVEDPNRVGTYTNACSMPSGYFNDGRTTYFTNGTSFCGFASPKHLEFFKTKNPANNLPQVEDPNRVGPYTNICPMPSGYFDYNNMTFYAAGDGTACSFANSQEYIAHYTARPEELYFGTFDRELERVIKLTGACVPNAVSPAQNPPNNGSNTEPSSNPPVQNPSSNEQGSTRARVWIECDADGEARIHVRTDPLEWPYPSSSSQEAGVWISSGGTGQGEGPMQTGDIQPKYVAPHKKGVNSVDYRIIVRFADGHQELYNVQYRWPSGCSPTQPQAQAQPLAPSESSSSTQPSPSDSTAQNPPDNGPSTQPPPSNSSVNADCPYDVCVVDIAVSDAPKRRQNVTFTATFVNKAPEPRYYDWLILLFDPNKNGPNKGFGESPHNQITVPSGTSTMSISFLAVNGLGPCMNLYAQAGIHKSATEKPAFPGSDGQPLSKYFDVCP